MSQYNASQLANEIFSQKRQAHLFSSDVALFDHFGQSVSLSGRRALIGASGDDGGTGSAYLFVYDGGTWTEQEKLLASDRATNDQFGFSVSLSGTRALIGAYRKDAFTGAAYIFSGL